MSSEYQNLPPATRQAVMSAAEAIAPEQSAQDVRESLSVTDKGKTANTIDNCRIVFCCDPLLRDAIRLNLLTDRVDIVRDLGWRRNTSALTDTDVKYLLLYFEQNYELTSEKKITAALSIVANEIVYYDEAKIPDGAYLFYKHSNLDSKGDFDEYLNELKGKLKKSEERLQKECEGLSKIRKKEAKLLQAKIAEGLQDLNFLDVCFEIRFSKTSGYTVEGTDEVEFMISMNPGEPTRPLATVASGGELSRIMLAIKAVMADKDEIETLIFDEIDVGISGRTAQKVSEKMCLIGRKHQVICITHLAQIAAMADTHYLIEKRVEDQMTKTKIRQLDGEESVQELGRILGGAKITDAVLKNAREMKILASGLKK